MTKYLINTVAPCFNPEFLENDIDFCTTDMDSALSFDTAEQAERFIEEHQEEFEEELSVYEYEQ